MSVLPFILLALAVCWTATFGVLGVRESMRAPKQEKQK